MSDFAAASMALSLSPSIFGLFSGFDVGQCCGHLRSRFIVLDCSPTQGLRVPDRRGPSTWAGRERGGPWPPRLGSKSGRSRRSTRERVTGRTPCPEGRARHANPARSAPQSTDRPPQDGPYSRASDAAAPADPAVGGSELDNHRMKDAAGNPCGVRRRKCRCAGQGDNEREWEQALAGEIHGLSGLLNLAELIDWFRNQRFAGPCESNVDVG